MPSRCARRFSPPTPRELLARLCALLIAASSLAVAATASALPLVIQTSTLADGTAGVAYSDAIVASSGTEPYSWSVVDGSLPGGLALDGGSGALSGTATLSGTSPFIVLVTDAVGDTATRAFSISIAPAAASALSFATGPSDVLTGATMMPAVQVKVEDGFGNAVPGALVSLSLVGSGTLSGGAAVASDGSGVATFAALSVDRAGSAQLGASTGAIGPVLSTPFTVGCPVIAVSPVSLPGGAQSVPYSHTVTASGGTSPYTFAVTAGALPGGLSLDGSGALTGTPTTGGQFGFTVTATDLDLCTASRAYSVVVCAPFTLLPASLAPTQFMFPFTQALTTTGGVAPFTFAVTAGALPPGITLSTAGLLAGTPSATGVFPFTVTATAAGGCTGFTAYSLTVPAVPAAVADLAATRVNSGNDADGTEKLQLSFTPPAFAASVEVYRAAFGGYPLYDDAGGLTPPTPSYPPGAPWVLTAVGASGQTDEPAARDAYAYVMFSKNVLGQVSSVSNQTPEIPNYALGDVSNGVVAGAGDNLVNDLDISLLGAHYGISGAAILSADVSYLDVGPTASLSVSSRPFTDGRIDFEDLVVFATNYGTVSGPASLVASAEAAARAATAPEALSVHAPAAVTAGETFDVIVRMDAAGRVQGLSMELGWDAAIAKPIAVAGAGWVESQHGVVWSARPGTFDAVLLGARARGLSGTGDLARVTFRAHAAGDPAIRIARVLARDAANRPLAGRDLSLVGAAAAPAHTLLLAPAPNPGRGARTVSFALAQPGDVDLAIYSVDGRRVRTLAHGGFAAGTYHLTWLGDDEQHHTAAPGLYFAQLVTGGRRYSRTLVHL